MALTNNEIRCLFRAFGVLQAQIFHLSGHLEFSKDLEWLLCRGIYFCWSLSLGWRDHSTSIAFLLQQSSNYFCRSIRFIFSWWIQLSFSVHERGYRSAIWSFSIMSGVTLSIMSAFVLWILLLTVGITGGLYSTAMWYRIRHGKWGFGLLPYLWGFASSLYYFLFRRCVNQFLSVIWLW